MHRRWRRRGEQNPGGDGSTSESGLGEDSGAEERQESQMLVDRADGMDLGDWEGWAIHILDVLCRFIAVMLVMGTMIVLIISLIYSLANGAYQIHNNLYAYQKGLQAWIAWCDDMRDFAEKQLKLSPAVNDNVQQMYTNVLTRAKDMIFGMVNTLLTFVTGSVSFVVMVMLYMLFWLFQPLPISGKASALVQSYLWKKTLVSFLYGLSVALLLAALGVDLPAFFGVVSFFLNFVPEVGALISMLAPVPLILLNGNIKSPVSFLFVALLGQVVLKLLIGNVLEVRLVSSDDQMSIHPVWVLLGLNYFGLLWGPVGMLISVPLLATLKSIVISKEEELKSKQPYFSDMASQVLACLEGRRRKDERRRSTWLLPFGSAGVMQKEKEPPHEGGPQLGAEDDAVKHEKAVEPIATAPKKARQPDDPRSAQPDIETQTPGQP